MSAGNDVFRHRLGTGWTRGLDVLLRAELSGWFRTRKWWVQILVWGAMINGLLLLIAYSDRRAASATLLVELFTAFMGTFAPIGVAILMQSVLVGEKRSGTAAWVLSKPASRTAFVVAKLGPYLPWNLVMPPNGGGRNPLASALIWGTEPATYLPLITVLGGSVLFVLVALWGIRRVEL